MIFSYADTMSRDFPELVSCIRQVEGVRGIGDVLPLANRFQAIASARLDGRSESDLPEIQAWRRVFSKMGLKPTQYRCASEALLRRLRKEGSLPAIHPLVDLCNAISIAFAIPVAVFDLSKILGDLEVRHADGSESYLTFSGEVEHPEPREVIFADAAGQAHARRWTNRQSGLSAVREDTRSVLIVAEAMHDSAAIDVPGLIDTIAAELIAIWSLEAKRGVLSHSSPRFDLLPEPNVLSEQKQG